jgi:predicted RNA-binding Zn-ribbon protein involved in translation (DUF1610 family)
VACCSLEVALWYGTALVVWPCGMCGRMLLRMLLARSR